MRITGITAILLLSLATSGMASEAQDRALVAVENASPSAASELLADGVMVLRDMGSYLLVAAEQGQLSRLDELGLAWEALDRSIEGKTYYTVAYTDPFALGRIEQPVRVLKITPYSAVIEASIIEADIVAAAGLEIAAVFMRPIRLRPEPRTLPPRTSAAPNPHIQAMVDAVSGSSVDAYVQRLQNFGTRYSFHDSCAAAGRYIKRRFESFGLDSVFFHHFQAAYNDNVVGMLVGKNDPDRQIVIGGHYDSTTGNTSNCPGADDNASGTSCVLECARVLSQYQFDYTIVFIAFCGEEQGLRGSEYYAGAAATRGDDIVAMVNVDMIGYVAPADDVDLDIIDDANSEWLSDRAVTVAGMYVPELNVIAGGRLLRGTSDHASFRSHGYDAILFHEDIDSSSPYIHTIDDLVGVSYNAPLLAERSVKTAVALVADLAGPINPPKPKRIFAMDQNRPNPFNGGTTIDYRITATSHVSLRVYDVSGRLVKTLVDQVQSPQDGYSVSWDGRNNAGQTLPSGIYFYRIVTSNFQQTRKIALLK